MRRLVTMWAALLNWFHRGDLVPLLIVVSAVHYAVVLQGRDYWPVAIAIGTLVDLGHYRTVLIAVRYTGDNKWQRIARWAVALTLTAVSLSYHWRFYGGDWLLAAPMPLLIATLAYFERVDRRRGQAVEPSEVVEKLPDSTPVAEPLPENGDGKKQRALELLATGTFNQKQVAELVGVHPATVSKWRKPAGTNGNHD
jgi:hypothetical protein